MDSTHGRRSFLGLLAGSLIAGWPRLATAATPRIVVIGGGMVGANCAYRLARRGAAVTLIERTAPAAGATGNSFAWINAHYSKQPWDYFYLNRMGIEAWQALDREMGGALPLRWGGSLEWFGEKARAAQFLEEVRRHQSYGFPAHLIDAARLRELEPHVIPGEVVAAAHSEPDGAVDPAGATTVLIERARAAGAVVRYPLDVTGFDERNGRIRAVRTSGGDVETDMVVLACGTDITRIAAMVGVPVPLKPSAGVLVHTTPQPRVLERLVMSPLVHMKQNPAGRIVAGGGFGAPQSSREQNLDAAQAFLKTAAQALPELGTSQIDRVTIGYRPLPTDDHPVIGCPPGRPDLYVAVMHSGITMGPLVGHLAASELLDGVRPVPLAAYRPDRFTR